MKKLIVIASLLFSLGANAQSFDGVSISGDLSTAISKYREKGYSVSQYFDQGVKLTGKVASQPIDLYIFTTPKSKKIFKMVVYFRKETSWVALRDSYIRMFTTLSNKYGEPDDYEAKFITPYYLGDGYELQAVELEKIDYHAYWFKRSNLTVGVEISKYKQVKLTYENNLMMDLKDREQAQLENNSF